MLLKSKKSRTFDLRKYENRESIPWQSLNLSSFALPLKDPEAQWRTFDNTATGDRNLCTPFPARGLAP